ncbi:MAG: hypothetical protein Q8P49_00310 [Candidatus Liptonbacteria bacterium]|nr:hypothetical protein [Candidatus Liptonbacteria bacterium]
MRVLRAFLYVVLALTMLVIFPGSSFGQKKVPSVSPEKLKIGQTITCSSVLGDKTDKTARSFFQLTFKGPTSFPGWPSESLILAEMKDVKLPVTGGMSGSPCTVNGKNGKMLVGALSMRLGNFPIGGGIAGITPIRAMQNPDATLHKSMTPRGASSFTTELFGLNESQVAELNRKLGRNVFVASSVEMEPAGDGKRDLPYRKIRPGESITGLIVDGAVRAGATCTVTYVDKDGYSICGHPIFGEPLVYPAYRSSVTTIVRSHNTSYKVVGKILEPVGTLVDDTPFAVKGVHEVRKDIMLPVHFVVSKNGELYDYMFSVVRHPYLSAELVDFGMERLVENLWSPTNVATAKISAEIYIKGRKDPIRYYGTDIISMKQVQLGFMTGIVNPWGIFGRVRNRLSAIQQSDWGLVVDRLEIKLDLRSGRQILEFDSLAVLDQSGKPTEEIREGDTIQVVIGLRNETSTEKFAQRFTIQIPDKLDLVSPKNESDVFLEAWLVVVGGSQYQDPKKMSRAATAPDSAEEFLDRLIPSHYDPSKVFAILVLPDEHVANMPGDTVSAPALEERKWQKVPDFKFLRGQARTLDSRMVTIELGAPSDAIVTIVYRKMLKFMIKK